MFSLLMSNTACVTLENRVIHTEKQVNAGVSHVICRSEDFDCLSSQSSLGIFENMYVYIWANK